MGLCVEEARERILQEFEYWMDKREEGIRTLIGWDFNARTGREGGVIDGDGLEGGEERKERKSKDKKINREGRELVRFLEEKGWGIFNGCVRGDEKGEVTFTGGKGVTVIDYMIGDMEVKERIDMMRIGVRVESGHQPIEVWVKGQVGGKRKREKRIGRVVGREKWGVEEREAFRRRLGRVELGMKG